MPIDSNLVTSVLANWQTPQMPDMLQQYAKIQALKNGIIQQQLSQQQLQTGALEMQQRQQALTDQQALDAAYRGAITTDPNGNISYDRAKVLSAVPGHLAPGISKTLTEMDQAKATLDETQAKARTDQINLLGNMLMPIVDSKYDPATFKSVITHAAGTGALDPHQAAAWLGQLGDNPTPDQIKTALAPYLGAPAVQELMTKRQTAQAATDRATAAGKTADIAQEKERVAKVDAALAAAAAAQTPDQLEAARAAAITAGATPDEAKRIPAAIDAPGQPGAQAALRRSLLTAEQQTTAAQAAANAAETARHNQQAEANAQARLAVERQNANINAAKYAQEYGGDAVKGWVEQVKANPDTANTVPPALRGAVTTQFTRETGLPFPKPLAGPAVTVEFSSRNALDAVKQIQEALADPEIQKRVGPILGRLGNVEQGAGMALGLTPDEEAKAQQLRTNMRYLVFQEGKALMGGRIPQNLMSQLEQSSPNVSMDAGTLKGALAGVTDAANRNLDQTFKQRYGENAVRPKPAAAATATTNGKPGAGGYIPGERYGNMLYLGGDPKDRANWK